MDDGVKSKEAVPDAPGNQRFVQWYETFHQGSVDWREKWLRARWFYHNKQWDSAEEAILKSRKQPANVYNEIKPVIDFLVGMEKQQRSDPKAYPRTPLHENDAFAATDAMRYLAQREEYDQKRSGMWFDMLTVGFGGLELAPYQKRNGEIELGLQQNKWDRMWWDIHSCEPDFSDARYQGLIRWMDLDEAVYEYGEDARDKLEATKGLQYLASDDVHEDKPRNHRWYDSTEKRVAICVVYYLEKGNWHFAEFTGGEGGLLNHGPSPVRDEEGIPINPYIWSSAYVDPDNCRFGLVEEMIDRQREVNKRGSKLIHHLSTERSFHKKGAIASEKRLKSELAKPDGSIEIAEHAEWGKDVGIIGTDAEVQGHFALLQDAKESIRRIGASSSMRGQDGPERSGVAIQAKQQANLVELGALMDGLRYVDRRAYRRMWEGIRQFWTGVKWIRVTDDENNVRFAGLNVPGEFADKMPDNVKPLAQPVAEMDVDIIIETAPDMITLQSEQFSQLIDLAAAGVTFPDPVYLEAAPNLRNKKRLLEIIAQSKSEPTAEQQAQMAKDQVDIAKKTADTRRSEIAAIKTEAEIDQVSADTGKTIAETEQIKVETALDYAEGVAGRDRAPNGSAE